MIQPLQGLSIWCTRPGRAGERSCRRFHDLGAAVVHAPTLEIRRVEPPAELVEQVLAKAAHFVVGLTSPTSVENFVRAFGSSRPDGRPWRAVAVGARTGIRAGEMGIEVVATAPRATAEDLAPVLLETGADAAILLPGSNLRRPDLSRTLNESGREVVEVIVQETVPGPGLPAKLRGRLDGIDLLVAYSPSALLFATGLKDGEREALARIPVAAMGPTTEEQARHFGLSVAVAPDRPDEDRLIGMICRHFERS